VASKSGTAAAGYTDLNLNPLPSAARVVDDWGVQSSGPWSVHIEMSDRAIHVADDRRKFIT
jgi:hypothetical protein